MTWKQAASRWKGDRWQSKIPTCLLRHNIDYMKSYLNLECKSTSNPKKLPRRWNRRIAMMISHSILLSFLLLNTNHTIRGWRGDKTEQMFKAGCSSFCCGNNNAFSLGFGTRNRVAGCCTNTSLSQYLRTNWVGWSMNTHLENQYHNPLCFPDAITVYRRYDFNYNYAIGSRWNFPTKNIVRFSRGFNLPFLFNKNPGHQFEFHYRQVFRTLLRNFWKAKVSSKLN